MTLFDGYLVRKLAATVLRVCTAFIGIFVLVDLLTARFEQIGRYEVPVLKAAAYYVYQLPIILFEYQVLSVALLAAGLMVFGRLAQNQELTALLAGGVSLRRLAVPALALGLLVSAGAFFIAETTGVEAVARQKIIDENYFRRVSSSDRSAQSWTNLGEERWTCHVLSFNREALTGQDVYLHLNGPDRVEEIRAGRIYWEPDTREWLLEEWQGSSERITQRAAPFSASPEELFALDQPAGAVSYWTLAADIERAERLNTPTQSARIALHEKVARPMTGFIMMLLALPFAARIRRGGVAAGFGASLAIGMVFLLAHFSATGLGHLGLLPPWFAAWIVNAVFFVGGTVLFFRTPT
jgi:lipopolysaccharide export system permease protein